MIPLRTMKVKQQQSKFNLTRATILNLTKEAKKGNEFMTFGIYLSDTSI